ncbi:MAG: adenine phosphoribosyltransferase [Immundisolibacterales bacterium]|nr:adenine phosphoribosyltransferase [Immundisolibacterales bacterium]
MHQLESLIRAIPDFPKPGILYRDITPLLADPDALAIAVRALAEPFRGREIQGVAGIEARGFIFGCLVARELSASFVPIRKPGKLPYRKVSESYTLEYGVGTIDMHVDALTAGDRVLVVDDLIATGGTAAASCTLVERLGGEVAGCCFVVELVGLEGRARLDGRDVHTLLRFD